MDVTSVATGAAALKTGLDMLRTALGLVKDVQGALPAGEKKDAVGVSLAQAERQLRTAEAEIAQGLGYKLCRCEFPPHPMLQVGHYFRGLTRRVDVHECPVCKITDAGSLAWHRTVGEGAGSEMPPLKGAPGRPSVVGRPGGPGSWMAR